MQVDVHPPFLRKGDTVQHREKGRLSGCSGCRSNAVFMLRREEGEGCGWAIQYSLSSQKHVLLGVEKRRKKRRKEGRADML